MELSGFHNASEILRSGVYALCAKGVVIYVGKSKQMISRINSHRSIHSAKKRGRKVADWIPIPGLWFDEIHIRPCRLEDMDSLERSMIDLYKPKYNVQLQTKMISTPFSLNIGGVALAMNVVAPRLERRV